MALHVEHPNDLAKRRIGFAFWLILLCYLSLVGRLLYLQGMQGADLRQKATDIRLGTIHLPAHRGSIFDRDKQLLAVSLYSGNVGFDPSIITSLPKEPKKATAWKQKVTDSANHIATILQLPQEELNILVERSLREFNPNAKIKNRFVPIKAGISWEIAQQIRETRPRLMGFGVEDSSKRSYPNGKNTAHIVGYLNSQGKGVLGIERGCRKWLDGKPGEAQAELDNRGRQIPDTLSSIDPAKDGFDIHTTLDAHAQHIATEEAEKIYAKYHPKGISIVIVDPTTGDILALVSMPNFDPNPEAVGDMDQNGRAVADTLEERCAAHLYEPGSTIKTLTIAAALESGTITPESWFYCGGELAIGKRKLHCDSHGGSRVHGSERPIDILRHSCNVGAATIGLRMGATRLSDAFAKFGLTEKLDLNLPFQPKGYLAYKPKDKRNVANNIARIAFGHAMVTTPVQLAMAYAAIANGGILMKPRLVTSLTESDGKVVQEWKPRQVRRVLSSKTSAEVCMMLREVVSNGTGKVAAIPGYQVGGKTGTARKYHANQYVGSFIGVVPASPNVQPRAVILVAVDEPQGAHYGADVAAPSFQSIASRLLTDWHVAEDDPNQTQAKIAAAKRKHLASTH